MASAATVSRRHFTAVGFVVVMVLAASLRFATLGTQSVWTDEGNTLLWLHGSFGHMLSAVAHNESSPPLYFCIAWLWTRVFGDWIVALRALSAVFGCATVAVGFWGARRICGARVATILGLLMATSAMLIWYSQEARQYALLLLLCTVSLVLWARVLMCRQDRAIVWWAAVSGLAVATHYFAVFIVLPEAAILLLRAPRNRNAVVAAAILAAFFAVVTPFAIYQRNTTNISWIAQSGSLISRVRGVEGTLLVEGGAGVPHAWWLGRLVVVAAFALVLWRGTPRSRRIAGSALALAAGVVVLATVAALVGFDYVLPRHLLPAYLPFAAALAVALGNARAGVPGLLVAMVCAAVGLAVTFSINGDVAYQREDVRDAVHALDGPRPDRIVVLQRPDDYLLENGGWGAFQYYAPWLRSMSGAALSVTEVDVIDEGVRQADIRATLVKLMRMGFRLRRTYAQQVFVTYRLVARRAIVVTREALRRDGRFFGASPVLLIE